MRDPELRAIRRGRWRYLRKTVATFCSTSTTTAASARIPPRRSRKSWPTCAAARSVGRSRCYRCRTECPKGGSSTARRCSG